VGLITDTKWRVLSKVLRVLGFGGCAVDFVLSMSLIAYYSVTRPHIPQTAGDWNVRLYWSFSPPSYGTANENAFLLSTHWLFFLFFVLIAVGEAIRIYKLERRPGQQ
jgi:hypothetical protein